MSRKTFLSLDNAPDGLLLVVETAAYAFDERDQLDYVLIFPDLVESGGAL